MNELPQNWIKTNFGSICDGGQYGWTTRASDKGSVKFLRTTDITKDEINWESVPYCQENPPDLDRYLVQENDILISRSGSVGFSTLISKTPFSTVFASYLIRFIPSEHVEPRYVAYFLESPEYWQQISEVASGIAISNVNAKKLTNIRMSLAPLNEQKRIADKLDNLFARVDECRDRLSRAISILHRFRQSILALAVSGQLTLDCRKNKSSEEYEDIGSRTLPIGWEWKLMKEVGNIQLGRQRAPRYHSGQHMRPYLRVQNVFEDRIDLSDVMEMDFPPEDFEKYQLFDGDILLNEGQSPEFLGRPAMYRDELPGACFTNTLIRFQAFDFVNKDFALLVFRHYMHSGRFSKEGKITTNIAHLSAGRFSEIEFPLPPVDEQREVVERVNILFAFAERFECKYKSAASILKQIPSSILSKAFRGELSEQDSGEESATDLLARIQTEKSSTPARVLRDRKPKMSKLNKDYVNEVILKMPKELFSFDELRESLSGDYDMLRDILFDLLDDSESSIMQVFDQESRSIQFVRKSE